MKNIGIIELTEIEMSCVNGGTDETAYNTGYHAGEVLGKMVRNLLTLVGIGRLISLL